jgi:hypothetical protein
VRPQKPSIRFQLLLVTATGEAGDEVNRQQEADSPHAWKISL